MFESELRDEQRSLQKLTAEVRQTIFRYESRIRDLKRKYEKSDGTAEKQIQDLIAKFQSDIDAVLKDFERRINKDLSAQIDKVTQQEAAAIRQIQEYSAKCKREYIQAAKSLVAVKGEL